MTGSDGTDDLGVVGNYVAGFLAGSAGIIVGFPFDTVKVRLQHQHGRSTTPMGVFTGILKHQGVSWSFVFVEWAGRALAAGLIEQSRHGPPWQARISGPARHERPAAGEHHLTPPELASRSGACFRA